MATVRSVMACGTLAILLSFGQAAAAVERDKLLSDTGVYGTFAAFSVDDDWWKLDQKARADSKGEVTAVFQKHADKVAIDTYLLRGLVERNDLLIRAHSTELHNNQNFLIDLMATHFGRYLRNTHTFTGITKAANYVPGFPDELKTALKTPPDPGPKPYAIVVPIRKDAEWWTMGAEKRAEMMQEHAEVTIAYLKTVKRKLYHSSGLDDLDFITYFETAKLDDFNNLIIALERVKENRHNKRFGNPTFIGTVHPIEEILDLLAR